MALGDATVWTGSALQAGSCERQRRVLPSYPALVGSRSLLAIMDSGAFDHILRSAPNGQLGHQITDATRGRTPSPQIQLADLGGCLLLQATQDQLSHPSAPSWGAGPSRKDLTLIAPPEGRGQVATPEGTRQKNDRELSELVDLARPWTRTAMRRKP